MDTKWLWSYKIDIYLWWHHHNDDFDHLNSMKQAIAQPNKG